MRHITSLEGISAKISQAIRLSGTSNINKALDKTSKSLEYNESNSIVDHTGTVELIPKPTHNLTKILEKKCNPEILGNYKKYFLLKKSPKKLFKHFCKEKFKMIKSDTSKLSFSIADVLLRLKSGYTIYKYGHKGKLRKYLRLQVEESILKIKTQSKCYKSTPFACIQGVILGCETFQFKKVKSSIDKNCGVIHNDYNCFSIITDTTTYDLASTSDSALYDICLGVSWLSYLYSEVQTSIPYTKYTLSITIIRMKLNEIAKARYMSVVELFLLAICKTLWETRRPSKKIFRILKKRFNGEGKVYRFIIRSIVHVVKEQQEVQILKTGVRISLLTNLASNRGRKKNTIFIDVDKPPIVEPFDWIAFFVPSNTSIFEKPKKQQEENGEVVRRRRYTSIFRRTSKFGI